jgi:hypothetical protein
MQPAIQSTSGRSTDSRSLVSKMYTDGLPIWPKVAESNNLKRGRVQGSNSFFFAVRCFLENTVWNETLSRGKDQSSAEIQEILATKHCNRDHTSLKAHQHVNTFVHVPGLCLHTASCNQLSATVQVSVYTQLHVTNCRPQFRSLSTHCFM